MNRHLTSDKFIKNENLIYKLRGLNNSNVDSIFKQAQKLTTVEVSDFWKKLAVI